jgi:hypothetical protein
MRLLRLSVRIWKLLDAHAEGLPAIGALALIVLALLVAKYLADLSAFEGTSMRLGGWPHELHWSPLID